MTDKKPQPQTIEYGAVVFDNRTGQLFQTMETINHVCDICGYIDATRLKTAVWKDDDGIYRCKICREKLNRLDKSFQNETKLIDTNG